MLIERPARERCRKTLADRIDIADIFMYIHKILRLAKDRQYFREQIFA